MSDDKKESKGSASVEDTGDEDARDEQRATYVDVGHGDGGCKKGEGWRALSQVQDS